MYFPRSPLLLVSTVFTTLAAALVGELGVATVTNEWTTVTFTSRIDSPVVVAKSPTKQGGDPVTVRLRNITPTGFQVKVQEWDYLDGSHTAEQLGWIAVMGGHQSDSNLEIDAGIVAISGTYDAGEPFMTVPFGSDFGSSTPVVASVVISDSGSSAVTTRNQAVSSTGFEVVMQEQEGLTDGHVAEFVAYVAITGSTSSLLTGRQGGVDSDFTFVGPLSEDFPSPMVVVADMQSFSGNNPAGLRIDGVDGEDSFSVIIEEEQAADDEVNHTSELVGYIVGSAGVL